MHCQRRTRGTARDFSWCWRCGQSERVGEFPTTGKIRHFENKLGKSSCTIYIYHCKSNIHNIKIFFSFPFYEFGMKKYKGNILLESRNELLSFPLKKLKIGCIWNIFMRQFHMRQFLLTLFFRSVLNLKKSLVSGSVS